MSYTYAGETHPSSRSATTRTARPKPCAAQTFFSGGHASSAHARTAPEPKDIRESIHSVAHGIGTHSECIMFIRIYVEALDLSLQRID